MNCALGLGRRLLEVHRINPVLAALQTWANGWRRRLRWQFGRPLSHLSGRWCRARLARLPPPHWPEKPPLPLPVITLCGRAHLPMLQVSLRTLVQTWPQLPPLRVVSDGSASLPELQAALRWWRNPLEICAWEDFCPSGNAPAATALGLWAARHPLGKKLAVLLAIDSPPVLWMDTDILWFGGLPATAEGLPGDAALTVTTDQFCSYAPELLAVVRAELSPPPYLNAGLVLLRRPLGELIDIERLLARAYPDAPPHHLAEQTLIALAARRHGRAWSREEIAMDVWDSHQLRPTFPGKPWAARHYTTPTRDLFWRDAWWLLARKVHP